MKLGRARALLAVLAGVSLLVLVPGAASAGTATWTVMTTPTDNDIQLNAVACWSTANCLAVGESDYNDTAEVYHGGAWTPVAAPDDLLLGVACPGPDNCIAVGSEGVGSFGRTVAASWQWNGSSWTALPTYNPSSTTNELSDIRCLSATSCEAVGDHDTKSGGFYALAEKWNGKTWSDQSTSGAPQGELESVACQSAGKCEAVGFGSTPSGVLAMGLSGSKWVTQTTPTLPVLGSGSSSGTMSSISCYQAGCLAVGQDYASEFTTEVATEVWNGTSWSIAGKVGSGDPSGSQQTEPASMRCSSASNCTMVGYWYATGNNEPSRTLADTWNGSAWTVNSTPDPGGSGSYDFLYGLACTASTCYGVGVYSPSGTDVPLAEKS